VGQWEKLGVDWWETNVVNCSFCGQMIPRMQWVSEHNGQRRVFHSPECEQLWLDYWVPRHGHTYPTVSKKSTKA
jgi:ribosomal protein L24E